MTCRHPAGYHDRDRDYSNAPPTPDASNYTIEDMARIGPHVVLKVKYPNCRSCSYEGNKVMVFLNVSEADLIKWRKIDPHFRDPKIKELANSAPGPVARFPANADGWTDALTYARGKVPS